MSAEKIISYYKSNTWALERIESNDPGQLTPDNVTINSKPFN
jgi:hypothetical protein